MNDAAGSPEPKKPRRIPARDPITMMEANCVVVAGVHSGGSVFLRMERTNRGHYVWGVFAELTPDAVTDLITDLCRVRNAAAKAVLTNDILKRD